MNETKETKSPDPPGNLSTTWKEFYENTTLHGLQNVFTSKHPIIRLIWLILVLGACGYLCFCMVNSIERYFQHPTTMKMSEEVNSSLPFPAISLCFQSFADVYKIYLKDNEPDFGYYGLNISACSATAEVRAGRPCGHALVCAFALIGSLQVSSIANCSKEYKQNLTLSLQKSNVTFDFMEFLRTFGESWEEVMEFCVHGTVFTDCNDPKLFKITTKNHRLCYTLNEVGKTIYSDYPGTAGGVVLLLRDRVERAYYPRYEEGFKVYLHEKGAGIGENGISATAGKTTTIGINREIFQLIDGHRNGCRTRTLQGFKTYTQAQCFLECRNNVTKKHCGCRLPSPGEYNDTQVCYLLHVNCLEKLYDPGFQEFRLNNGCDCPKACSMTKYKTSVSYGNMPRRNIIGVLNMFGLPDYSEKEFLVITVYFDGHRDVIFTQNPIFSFTSLLGEVGGNMGLLLGCSLMTLMEFVFLIFYFLVGFLKHREQIRDINSPSNNAWQ